MKEATGELNVTVFVIISIGVLSSFFFTIIWPGMQSNMNKNVKCNQAINCKNNGDGTATCDYYEDGIIKEANISCIWKG